jgi:hypothetical protein
MLDVDVDADVSGVSVYGKTYEDVPPSSDPPASAPPDPPLPEAPPPVPPVPVVLPPVPVVLPPEPVVLPPLPELPPDPVLLPPLPVELPPLPPDPVGQPVVVSDSSLEPHAAVTTSAVKRLSGLRTRREANDSGRATRRDMALATP